MNPIEEILSILSLTEPLTAEQTARLDELFASLNDEELAEAEAELSGLFDDIRTGEMTADAVARLTGIADYVDGLRAVAGERMTAAAEAEALAAAEAEATATALAELEARMNGLSADDGDDDEGTDDGDDGDEPAEVEPVEEPAADPAPAPAAAGAVGNPAPPSPRGTTAPAAARSTASIRGMKNRSPITTRPRPQQHQGRITLKRAGGGEFNSMGEIDDALLERWADLEGTEGKGRHRVATFSTSYDPERTLPEGRITDVTDMVEEIRAKVSERGGVESLVADGGLCAPVENFYGTQTIAQASRPLRSSIGSFQAKRGGIQFMPPMTLSTILSATTPTAGRAIGVVSEAQDAASTYDKSVQAISCGSLTTKKIDAVYRQLEFGNFIDRTNPERVSQFTDLSLAAYARFSEQRLFNAMVTASTAQHTTQQLGASRDLINILNRAAINYRSRHRMDVNATIDVVIPAWVGMGLLPEDQNKQIYAGQEQFDVTAAWCESKLRAKNINVLNWYQDDFTDAVVAGGFVNTYPASFTVLLFHPGAHVYIDSGELNLGVVRDSTLNVSNIFRTFQEEFWTNAMWGVESDAIAFSLCANGASAGTIAPKCGS